MELKIAKHGANKDLIIDQWKKRDDGKKGNNTLKKPIEESMTLNTTPIKKKSTQDKKKKVRQTRPTYEKEMRCFILKELKKKSIIFLTLMCLSC